MIEKIAGIVEENVVITDLDAENHNELAENSGIQNDCDTSNVNIIQDLDGKKIVIINDVRFRSRRSFVWDDVESYLKEYIGEFYEIIETCEKVYIGPDFPDEFVHSEDRIRMKGANLRAKANAATAIGNLVKIATNKSEYPDYDNKHGAKAEKGWYKYDTRFGLPVYRDDGELLRYNIFRARMLVRCDKDGDLYLYDFVKIRKETCSPPR